MTNCDKVSQSVTKCYKVSQNVTKFTKHSFRDVVSGEWVGGWKLILIVYSSGPTFELELELESDLT